MLEALSDYSRLLVLRRRLVLLCSGESLSNIDVAKSTSRVETISLHLVYRYSGIVLDNVILLVFVIRYPLMRVLASVVSCVMGVFPEPSSASLIRDALIIC